MDIVHKLPKDLQMKVFRFYAQHPCAKLIHEQMEKQYEHLYNVYDYGDRYIKTGRHTKQQAFDLCRRSFAMNYFVRRYGDSWLFYT